MGAEIFVAVIVIIFIITRLSVLLSKTSCKSEVSMAGKIIIVTGANNGLGFETAKDVARRGGHVILACRSEARALAARDRIVKETGNSDVVYKHLDMSSLESVRRFAADINSTESRLDVLVNNAGVNGCGDRYTTDGIVEEMINYEHINEKGYYWDMWWYANSKLCMVLFTVELAQRLRGSGVTVNAVHPGIIRTTIIDTSCVTEKTIFSIIHWFGSRNVVEGAQTIIYLAVAEEVAETTGKYFIDCKERYMTWKTNNKQLSAELWKYSEKMVGHNVEMK